jgi:hypothetical protein
VIVVTSLPPFYTGSIRFITPMLFALAFLPMFEIGRWPTFRTTSAPESELHDRCCVCAVLFGVLRAR